jgi:hydroxymethylglutaryl-CoA reductase (NADPH)
MTAPVIADPPREKNRALPLVPRFKDQGYSDDALAHRRRWVEKQTGCRLRHVAGETLDGEAMRGKVENPIGTAQTPLGVAGPLRVNGRHAQGVFYLPMAMAKGAILRSYERGMVAVSRAGGVEVRLAAEENRISPVFFFADLAQAHTFLEQLPGWFADLKGVAEATTRHGRLLRIEPHPIGREVIVDMVFSTGDAMGMNMIGRAADAACQWLMARIAALRYSLFSGFDSEKRASFSLLTGGKGRRAVAAVRMPESLSRSFLHATPQQLADNCRHSMVGHLQAGALGCSVHLANGLAALFIACGQDVANITNAANGITHLEVAENGDLYATLTLPSLTVATVGGGTGVGTARECLEMIDCHGDGKAAKFAEIVAAALLAGELSLAAAIAAGEFVEAQMHYGRGERNGGQQP